jgi:aspartyl-tRNA(Asn)/glutamyl-tRNA(Gln) amidotransferase subunit C
MLFSTGESVKISREDALRVAGLAHLDLTEAELATYQEQLDSILTYVDKLNELDTRDVEPMAGGRPLAFDSATPEDSSLREDTPRTSAVAERAISFAPDPATTSSGRYFRVPKVIDR